MDVIRKFEQIATVVAIAGCICALAATAIVVFGHVPQVFNQGLRTNQLLNAGLLANAVIATKVNAMVVYQAF